MWAFAGSVHTYHDDTDADPDPTDDVQSAVEHLVNGCRTALTSQGERKKVGIEFRNSTTACGGGRQHNNRRQAVCVWPVTVVMRISSPSFLGQMSLAASITVPVGPQQFSCNQKVRLVTILVLLGTKITYDSQTHVETVTSNHSVSQMVHS